MATVFAVACMTGSGAASSDGLTVVAPLYYANNVFFQPYIDKYGRRPSFLPALNDSQAFELIRNGVQAHVAQTCMASLPTLRDAGLLAPWDRGKLREFALADPLSRYSEDLEAFRDYFVPINYGTTRLVFNPLQVPRTDVASLDVFTDPEYAGRLSLPTSIEDLAAVAFLSQGITDWSAATDAKFAMALAWLEAVHPNLHSYWDNEEQLALDFANEDVLVAWTWNSVVFENKNYSSTMAFAPATSGISSWSCGYVRLASADGYVTEAHDFVNAGFLEASARLVLTWGMGVADAALSETLSRERDEDETGLSLVGGPLFLQTPMPSDLWKRFETAVQRLRSTH